MFLIKGNDYDEVDIPDHPNYFYAEKIREYQANTASKSDNRNIKTQVDWVGHKIDSKELVYLTEFQTYAIRINVAFTIVFESGRRVSLNEDYYYLLHQK